MRQKNQKEDITFFFTISHVNPSYVYCPANFFTICGQQSTYDELWMHTQFSYQLAMK